MDPADTRRRSVSGGFTGILRAPSLSISLQDAEARVLRRLERKRKLIDIEGSGVKRLKSALKKKGPSKYASNKYDDDDDRRHYYSEDSGEDVPLDMQVMHDDKVRMSFPDYRFHEVAYCAAFTSDNHIAFLV